MTENEIIKKYAQELRRIYLSRTMGDYTFEGLLSVFAAEMKEANK